MAIVTSKIKAAGRAQEKIDKISRIYFIITYQRDGGTDYLSFDCTGAPGVNVFVKAFQGVSKERKMVDL